MLKKTAVILVSLAFSVGMISAAFSAQKPEGEIKVEITGAKPAYFDHSTHEKRAENCQVCHHKNEKGAEEKCTTCHTKEGKDEAVPGKKAFHTQCGGCHKKNAKGPQYPKDCKVCHKTAQGA